MLIDQAQEYRPRIDYLRAETSPVERPEKKLFPYILYYQSDDFSAISFQTTIIDTLLDVTSGDRTEESSGRRDVIGELEADDGVHGG